MAYRRITGNVPLEKRGKLSTRLADIILKSKNDAKMPNNLAKNILHHWLQGPLLQEDSLAALLEAAVLLEPEKTVEFMEQKLQLPGLAKAVKQTIVKAQKT